MTASTAVQPAVHAAFASLIDYAGLFPPAELPLAAAQAEYQGARTGPYAWMLGRFIIRASLLDALPVAATGPFSVIVESDVDVVTRLAPLRSGGTPIEALEFRIDKSVLPDQISDAIGDVESAVAVAGFTDVPAFVEMPRGERWSPALPIAMQWLRRMRLGAKLRCGGVTAEAFPGIDEVAEFIGCATDAGVPFKATAGLHHPVRHRDPATGFMMHGFLNILAAAALAARVQRATLARITAEEDPGAFAFGDDWFAWRDRRIGLEDLEKTRHEAFVGYGSCSFAEPVDDLIALGVLPSR
jgi:hypothetical protein